MRVKQGTQLSDLYLASNNLHKANEVSAILGCPVKLPAQLGLNFAVTEDGGSFIANALIKAKALYSLINRPVIADDSGLIVEALPGELGVETANFAGDISQQQKNSLLLDKMQGVSNRAATFVCVAILYEGDNNFTLVKRELAGEIARQMQGEAGFGYDSVFYLAEYGETLAQLDEQLKNKLSHRALAFSQLKKIIMA
ncbi:MAG: RdgB/HAM1 family non-canonical purine NTP pyrophosphatase [Spirochaetaceae bacterium]|nr:RdgB/HAM1 family non-canonical purine NTP pyrophosphatase [Spirochaetaceae bacterium]